MRYRPQNQTQLFKRGNTLKNEPVWIVFRQMVGLEFGSFRQHQFLIALVHEEMQGRYEVSKIGIDADVIIKS